MSDERRMSEVEEMLRAAGAPEDPPAHLRDVARTAALGKGGDVVRLRPTLRMDNRLARLSLAAAVLLASALAALVIGVGGNNMSVDRRISLDGAPAAPQASASIEFGSPNGAIRPVVVRVNNLAPAPSGGYYELWMQTGRPGEPTGMVTFNTGSGGDVVARTTMPTGMTWTRCWVTLETQDGRRSTVLVTA
jgi:hypothetical protein